MVCNPVIRRSWRERSLPSRAGSRCAAKPYRLQFSRNWFGTTKSHRLEENIGAAKVEITTHDLAEIERAAADIQIEGERYPEHLMKTVGR